MPGFGVADHQVARHVVAVHRDARLRERAATSRSHDALPLRAARRRSSVTPHSRSRTTRETARARAAAARRRRAAARRIDAQLPLHQRGDRVAHQRVGARRVVAGHRACSAARYSARRGRSSSRKPCVGVALEHLRRVQAGAAAIRPRDPHERAHVLLRRRRVHHDEAAASGAVDAQVAPKARVGSTRCAASRRQAVARCDAASQASKACWRAASGQAMAAGAVASGHASTRRQSDESERVLVDNRFYKSRCSGSTALRRRRPWSALGRAPLRRPCCARCIPAARRCAALLRARADGVALALCAAAPLAPSRRGARRPHRHRAAPAGCAAAARRCARRPADHPARRRVARPPRPRGRWPRATSSCGAATCVIRADRLSYDQADDLARARRQRAHQRTTATSSPGPRLQLQVQRFEGFFLSPTFTFGRTGAGGTRRAHRLPRRRTARSRRDATYTSCPRRRLRRPGLAAQRRPRAARLRHQRGRRRRRACCASSACRSWRRRAELSAHRRAQVGLAAAEHRPRQQQRLRSCRCRTTGTSRRTATRRSRRDHAHRRGAGAGRRVPLPRAELQRRGSSSTCCRTTASTGSARYALRLQPRQRVRATSCCCSCACLRVSDDDYWKDFPRDVPSLTPRLLRRRDLQRDFARAGCGDWTAYAARAGAGRCCRTADPTSRIEAPYQRMPQIGARTSRRLRRGLRGQLRERVQPLHATRTAMHRHRRA